MIMYLYLQDLKYLNQAVSSAHSIKLGAKRQLDALLSSSPGITSPAKRPYMEVRRQECITIET